MSLRTDKPASHARELKSLDSAPPRNEKPGLQSTTKSESKLHTSIPGEGVESPEDGWSWLAKKLIGVWWVQGDHRVDRKVPGNMPRRRDQV